MKFFTRSSFRFRYLTTKSEVVTANLKLRPCRIDQVIVRSIQLGWGLRFCCNDQMVKVVKDVSRPLPLCNVTHTSCIADREGKHDAKGGNIFHKNGM